MKPSYFRRILVVLAAALLTACAHFERIRASSPVPSTDLDHCPVCMDLGQAWALFRMGAYDDAERYCALVTEEEPRADTRHARRARDIRSLSMGTRALQAGDYPTAWALFREIDDPRLRELGLPYVDAEGWSLARESRTSAREQQLATASAGRSSTSSGAGH